LLSSRRISPITEEEHTTTVAKLLIESVAEHGVTHIWGVVGDALNPVTDAI
jgi:thiamine pyrophosphate-dependent acetolactate synthase large subunit-like protein